MFEELIMSNEDQDADMDMLPLFSLDEENEFGPVNLDSLPTHLPLLALKNTVLFPGVMIPITVGRERSIEAVRASNETDRLILVVAQRKAKIQVPKRADLYDFGVLARIVKIIKMPDGTNTAILHGQHLIRLEQLQQERPYLQAQFEVLLEQAPQNQDQFDALASSIRDLAHRIVELSPNIPTEAGMVLKNIEDNSFLINFIASNLNVNVGKKQELLSTLDLETRAERVLQNVNQELKLLELKDKIETRVRGDLEKQQRDYFLNQQLKTIQEELGQNPQEQEIEDLQKRAKKKQWSKEIQEHFDKELKKLRRINPAVAEYSVMLNYLDFIVDLPWDDYSTDSFDLNRAEAVLDKDHFGLDKVKKRILEHLAVLKLRGDMKSPIICLVGPPGVGKTSLGKSVAKALKREYVRMSLGGMHDESEIRGHRRTYIGAMPGRILQSIRKAGTSNPVFILDELDKVGKDFRGDPSSALLEVLDPEQNTTFQDNYLEVSYDLSNVLFIATANSLSTIQPALRDRMEIIQVAGYSIEEKVEIAKKHLLPKQRKVHGLKADQIRIGKKTLQQVAQNYTRESGVRSLERQIAQLMRHAAKRIANDEVKSLSVAPKQLRDILGPPHFEADMYEEKLGPGVAVGLAWTQVGGDILFIESSLSKGKGKLTLTGNLGDVMKESATTALSYLRAHAEEIGIPHERFEETDIHVHVPAGAIPKDGPSAGITMLSALCSSFLDRPLTSGVAMTGEITLRGKVLPVGGIKEKILAAKRAGIHQIILCERNEKHIEEIEDHYIEGMEFHYVNRMSEVLQAVGLLKD